jgi:hypothetical protein
MFKFTLKAEPSFGPCKMISADEYIEQRLNDQISWYDRKSGMSQLWFKRLRFGRSLRLP